MYVCVRVFRRPHGHALDLLTGRWPIMSPDISHPDMQSRNSLPAPRTARRTPPSRAPITRAAVSAVSPRGRAGRARHSGPSEGERAGAETGRILHRAWRSLFEEQDLAPTSTKASVRSLARSITGKWRPATIFTFSFPGIVSASAFPWAPAETNKRVCAERQVGRGRGGSLRGAARARGSAPGN